MQKNLARFPGFFKISSVFLVFFKILSVFLVFLKSRPFSWFLQNLARQSLLSTDGFLRSFRLLVSHRSLRPRSVLFLHHIEIIGPHADAISLAHLSLCYDRVLLILLLLWLCSVCSLSRRHTFFFVCPRGGSVTG